MRVIARTKKNTTTDTTPNGAGVRYCRLFWPAHTGNIQRPLYVLPDGKAYSPPQLDENIILFDGYVLLAPAAIMVYHFLFLCPGGILPLQGNWSLSFDHGVDYAS